MVRYLFVLREMEVGKSRGGSKARTMAEVVPAAFMGLVAIVVMAVMVLMLPLVGMVIVWGRWR